MSSICFYSKKKLNLRKRRWLELLKDYIISVLYHPNKANVVADALSSMNMGHVSHVEEGKKYLVKVFIEWLGGCLDRRLSKR